jgi:hypothetical protein
MNYPSFVNFNRGCHDKEVRCLYQVNTIFDAFDSIEIRCLHLAKNTLNQELIICLHF